MSLVRPRRQVEVFDIAIVAVVTKALGAFIVLVIMLLPYYRSDPANAPAVQAVRDHLRDARLAIEMVQQALNEKAPDPAALSGLVERSRQSLDEAQGFVQALRNSLDQASAQIGRLEAREADLEQQIAKLQAELSQASAQVGRLQAERGFLEQSNSSLKAENADLRANDQKLKTANGDLQRRNRTLEGEIEAAAAVRTKVASLEQEARNARSQNDIMRQRNENLSREVESLRQRANRSEDPALVIRWFSVGLAMPECSDIEFSLYVRWEGPLRNGQTGVAMPEARKFDAGLPEQRTALLGHRYFDLGAKGDTGVLGERALQEGGFGALARTQTQFKMFYAVSRVPGNYSVYVAAKDPQAFRRRECAVYPFYLTWAGPTLGQKVVLTQKRPFAWLRRFRINKDGTNTLGIDPKDDSEFVQELDAFSKAQSENLCRERKICDTEDAQNFALRAAQRGSRGVP